MLSIFRCLLVKRQQKSCRKSKIYFRPRLEALEERWCLAADTWNPQMGSILWSVDKNWSLGVKPGVGDDAIFDHNVADKAVSEDIPLQNAKVNSIRFQNGFTSPLALTSVGLEAVNSSDLTNNGATVSIVNTNTGCTLKFDNGATLNNFNIQLNRGSVTLKAGTLTVQTDTRGDTLSDFLVSGGTLNIANKHVVTFHKGAGITVGAGATMTVQNMNTTVLSDNNDGGIIENFGTFSFTGAAFSNTIADMAFLNDNNATFDTGTFNFAHTSSATDGYAYKMDSGTTTLRHGITVDMAGNGYYQTGGTLSSPDNTSTELFMNANYGKAEIDGGIVALGSAPGAGGQPVYGTLIIFGTAKPGVIDLAFNGGEFDAKIDGQAGGDNHEDRINVTLGNVTIGGNSTLKVTAVNLQPGQNVVPGQSWDIITRATKITGDFANKTLPTGVTGPNGGQLPTIYELNS